MYVGGACGRKETIGATRSRLAAPSTQVPSRALGDTTEFLGFQPGQEDGEVSPREGPLKWSRGVLVSRLEGEQPILKFVQGRTVITTLR